MSVDYASFLASKSIAAPEAGIVVDDDDIHPSLFPFQRDITRWALRKGRALIAADTGLGKTRQQLEWARLTGQRALILAPLAVAQQTIREAAQIDIEVVYAHHQAEAGPGITITNYERLDRFAPAAFGAVVLDEAGILKAFSGSTKKALVKAFRATPYRLCCTATPAPNDIEELCNQADFLGVMSPQEMRSTFFIADSRGEFMRYRLKRHAKEPFYRWLSSWMMALRMPSDLGYEDGAYVLPPLNIEGHIVETDWRPDDRLFAVELRGITEASQVRRGTLEARAQRVADLIAAEPGESWIVWRGLLDEGRRLAELVPGTVTVEGSEHPDVKASKLLDFAEGRTRVLTTDAAIAGFGLNLQRCARMAFLGLGYSYESYYQCIRRCYRFGQTRPVDVHIVLSEPERTILEVVRAKEVQARELSGGLLAEVRDFERAEIFAGTSAGDDYEPSREMTLPDWLRGAA